jgi:hypothetical protein
LKLNNNLKSLFLLLLLVFPLTAGTVILPAPVKEIIPSSEDLIPEAEASGSWLSGYNYRINHTINQTSGAGTNYQVPVKVIQDGHIYDYVDYVGGFEGSNPVVPDGFSSPLSDDFNDNSLNTTKWTEVDNGADPTNSNVSETNNRLEVSCESDGAPANAYMGVVSNNAYSMTNGFSVHVNARRSNNDLADAGTDRELGIWIMTGKYTASDLYGQNNWIRFLIYATQSARSYYVQRKTTSVSTLQSGSAWYDLDTELDVEISVSSTQVRVILGGPSEYPAPREFSQGWENHDLTLSNVYVYLIMKTGSQSSTSTAYFDDFRISTWDMHHREMGNIIYNGSDTGKEYKLSYSAYYNSYGSSTINVGTAYSTDGIDWTSYTTTDHPSGLDKLEDPYVLKDESTYYMFAEDHTSGESYWNMSMVKSTDFETWTNRRRVLSQGPNDWDGLLVGSPIVWNETFKLALAKGAVKNTTVKKFGDASVFFDGTNDVVKLAGYDDWYWGSDNFTVDCWVLFDNLPSSGDRDTIWSWYETSTEAIQWGSTHLTLINSSGTLKWEFYVDETQIAMTYDCPTTPVADTWYHVAIERANNNFTIFQDGAIAGSTIYDTSIPPRSHWFLLGDNPAPIGARELNGNIDEFRISNVSRWNSTAFTPPTQAYTTDSYTKLLLDFDDTFGASDVFKDESGSKVYYMLYESYYLSDGDLADVGLATASDVEGGVRYRYDPIELCSVDNWAEHSVTPSVSGGVYTGTITGADPYVYRSNAYSIDGSVYDQVVLKMWLSTGASTSAQIFWGNEDGSYGGGRSKSFTAKADSQWHIYVINMDSHAHWDGKTIDDFRIDPTTSSSGTFKVDYVAAASREWFKLEVGSSDDEAVFKHTGVTWDWDEEEVACDDVKYDIDTNTWYMLYHADGGLTNRQIKGIGFTKSTNLIDWTRCNNGERAIVEGETLPDVMNSYNLISNTTQTAMFHPTNDRLLYFASDGVGSGHGYTFGIWLGYIDKNQSIVINSSYIQSDFDDFRFTDDDGTTELDYWPEEIVNDEYAVFWVEVADDISAGDVTFNMYFGNSTVSSAGDGDGTFQFFDDFNDGSINLTKWTVKIDAPTESGGALHCDNDDDLEADSSYGLGYAWRARAKGDEQDVGFIGYYDRGTNYIDIYNSDATQNNNFDSFQLPRSSKAGTSTMNTFDTGYDFRNTYRTYEIQRINSSRLIGSIDGLPYFKTSSSYIPTVSMPIRHWAWDSSQESTLDVDHSFVRKIIDPEPLHGTWFSIEELPISAHTADLSDTNVLVDTLTRQFGKEQSVEDLIDLDDLLSTKSDVKRNPVDILEATESLGTEYDGVRTLFDYSTMNDALGTLAGLNRALIEIILSVESLDTLYAGKRTLAILIDLTDSITAGSGRGLSTLIIINDSLSRTVETTRLLLDPLTIIDLLFSQFDGSREIDDMTLLEESLDAEAGYQRTGTEVILVSDFLTRLQELQRSMNDPITIIDTLLAELTGYKYLTDIIFMIENIDPQYDGKRQADDVISTVDFLSRLINAKRVGTEEISQTDEITIGIGKPLVTIISMTDFIIRRYSGIRFLTDIDIMVDSIIASRGQYVFLDDLITIIENISPLQSRTITTTTGVGSTIVIEAGEVSIKLMIGALNIEPAWWPPPYPQATVSADITFATENKAATREAVIWLTDDEGETTYNATAIFQTSKGGSETYTVKMPIFKEGDYILHMYLVTDGVKSKDEAKQYFTVTHMQLWMSTYAIVSFGGLSSFGVVLTQPDLRMTTKRNIREAMSEARWKLIGKKKRKEMYDWF